MAIGNNKCSHPYENNIPALLLAILSEENPIVYAAKSVNYCTYCGQELSKAEKHKRLSSIREYAITLDGKIQELVRKLEVNI